MKLHEHEACGVLRRHGVPFPRFEVVESADGARRAADRIGRSVVLKAQVQVGGRGKAGGVKLAEDPRDAEEKARAMLGMDLKGLRVERLLVAEAVDIAQEYYVGVVVDRATRGPVVMASAAGGVDIEEVARDTPEKIVKHPVDPVAGLRAGDAGNLAARIESRPEIASQIASVIEKLYAAFVSVDASLAEVNPLVVTPGGIVWAVDAKIVIDDNALFRHPDIGAMRDTAGETPELRKARDMGLSYVKLDGSVGCLVNGAGLAMATMDLIGYYGGEPANFLDIGGSSSPEKVVAALDVITADANVKSILVNIFGGITRCDDMARGLVAALSMRPTVPPVVVRLAGTNEREARAILGERRLSVAETMDEAVKKAVELARRSA